LRLSGHGALRQQTSVFSFSFDLGFAQAAASFDSTFSFTLPFALSVCWLAPIASKQHKLHALQLQCIAHCVRTEPNRIPISLSLSLSPAEFCANAVTITANPSKHLRHTAVRARTAFFTSRYSQPCVSSVYRNASLCIAALLCCYCRSTLH